MPKVSENLLVSTPFISCTECNDPNNAVPMNFPLNYFFQEISECSNCKKPVDWWNAALNMLMMPTALFSQGGAALLGAKQHLIIEYIPLLGHIEIELEKYGIPANSTILYVNYTGSGTEHSFLPLNWHGNEPFPRKIPRKLFIYGIPMPLNKAREIPSGPIINKINVMVTFLPHGDDDHALKNLGRAYKAFLDAEYEEMIIPAHVAVEDSLKQCITLFCDLYKVGKADQNWDAMLYHSLPLMLDRSGFPRLPDHIITFLDKLYGLRNMLAHVGKLKDGLQLDQKVTAERLCAAIFATRYLLMLKAKLASVRSKSGT